MARNTWFTSIESMFYEALEYYDIFNWSIEPMPGNVDTRREALTRGQGRGWPFRTHNARAKFKCFTCKKRWTSGYTTVVWRARWETGIVQIAIEKQGCRQCNKMCQGYLEDDEQIEFALDWMCKWILNEFYDIPIEDNENGDDEPDGNEEFRGPHDDQRCEAGKKGTCRKCNRMRQPH